MAYAIQSLNSHIITPFPSHGSLRVYAKWPPPLFFNVPLHASGDDTRRSSDDFDAVLFQTGREFDAVIRR